MEAHTRLLLPAQLEPAGRGWSTEVNGAARRPRLGSNVGGEKKKRLLWSTVSQSAPAGEAALGEREGGTSRLHFPTALTGNQPRRERWSPAVVFPTETHRWGEKKRNHRLTFQLSEQEPAGSSNVCQDSVPSRPGRCSCVPYGAVAALSFPRGNQSNSRFIRFLRWNELKPQSKKVRGQARPSGQTGRSILCC